MSEQLVILDVSELAPPAPMQAIVAALSTLATGQVLKVHHRREPVPLYDVLQKQHISWRHQQLADAEHVLLLWQQQDEQAEKLAESHWQQINSDT